MTQNAQRRRKADAIRRKRAGRSRRARHRGDSLALANELATLTQRMLGGAGYLDGRELIAQYRSLRREGLL